MCSSVPLSYFVRSVVFLSFHEHINTCVPPLHLSNAGGSGGFFSRAYVAHCVADGVVVGIRAITPLAHVYCFHWLIYPLIRKQLKRTVLMPLFMKAASILPVDWVLWIVGKMTANLKSSAGSAGAKVAHISDVVERTSSATATRSMIPIYSLAIRLLKMMFKYWMVIEVLFFYFYLYRYYKLNRVVGTCF